MPGSAADLVETIIIDSSYVSFISPENHRNGQKNEPGYPLRIPTARSIAPRLGKSQSQGQELPQSGNIVWGSRGICKELGQLRQLFIEQESRGVLSEKACCDKNAQLFGSIKLKDAANAIEHFLAHAAITRFEPTKRAAIDLGKAGDLFLSQPTFGSQTRQEET